MKDSNPCWELPLNTKKSQNVATVQSLSSTVSIVLTSMKLETTRNQFLEKWQQQSFLYMLQKRVEESFKLYS